VARPRDPRAPLAPSARNELDLARGELARARVELILGLAGAIAASVGDLALLWVAWAADGRFGFASPPAGTLLAGHYLGILGIPLYGLGYRALARGIRAAAPRAARAVALLGAVGSVVGAVVHGLTGALTATALRTGAVTAPDAMAAIPEAALLLPLWAIVAVVLALGSAVFATVVGQGGTRFPRACAVCNPLLATLVIAMLAAPFPVTAAFIVPAAPNLAHVVVFATMLLILSRGVPRSYGRSS
jgi:hypothetical protein